MEYNQKQRLLVGNTDEELQYSWTKKKPDK